jgi:hypothetical protein
MARAVRGASGVVTTLPPLRTMVRVRCALESEVLDVGPDGFGDSQPVEGQHADQCVISGAGQPGGDQQGTDFVAVQAGGVGLVVQAGSAHMSRRRHRDQAFLFGVPVEAGHGA